jgi:hypothetical protein
MYRHFSRKKDNMERREKCRKDRRKKEDSKRWEKVVYN